MPARIEIAYEVNERGCWICTSHRPGHTGYPELNWKGRSTLIHRVMWEDKYGPVPEGTNHLCHTCDDTMCINPDHQYPGTPADNARDRTERGHHLKGAAIGNSKLNDDKVAEIKRLKGSGRTGPDVADEYGVSKSLIYQIWAGLWWKHVT